jgi:hypothetical protein
MTLEPFELTPVTECDLFLDRIAKITNIFEFWNWYKKHHEEIKRLANSDRKKVMKALDMQRVELEADENWRKIKK